MDYWCPLPKNSVIELHRMQENILLGMLSICARTLSDFGFGHIQMSLTEAYRRGRGLVTLHLPENILQST